MVAVLTTFQGVVRFQASTPSSTVPTQTVELDQGSTLTAIVSDAEQSSPTPSPSSNGLTGPQIGALIGSVVGFVLTIAIIYCCLHRNSSDWATKDLSGSRPSSRSPKSPPLQPSPSRLSPPIPRPPVIRQAARPRPPTTAVAPTVPPVGRHPTAETLLALQLSPNRPPPPVARPEIHQATHSRPPNNAIASTAPPVGQRPTAETPPRPIQVPRRPPHVEPPPDPQPSAI